MTKPVTTKSLEGIGDLTLLATVKPGFVEALEAITFATRLKLTLEALFRMRATAREFYRIRPFVDTAERIQSLLDFRITLLPGEPRQVLLTVTFDRPFEPYMRLIWWPLGALLDLVFCHCEDYPLAGENSFDTYLEWVRKHLVDTDFFYAADELSVADHRYLTAVERLQRDTAGDCSLAAAGTTVRDVLVVAGEVQQDFPAETRDIAVEALASLYRLTEFYPADLTGDGRLLHRAMRALLHGWTPHSLPGPAKALLSGEIAWWDQDSRRSFVPEAERLTLDPDPDQVQPGILRPYAPAGQTSHGCLLLLRTCDGADVAAVRSWIAARAGEIEWQSGKPPRALVNLAFTHEGLARLGVPTEALKLLPAEFRDGMEKRAPSLGDVRAAHPRNWTPPRRYAAPTQTPRAPAPAISLSAVDMVLHLRVVAPYPGHSLIGNADHPLWAEVQRLSATASAAGIELLAVEPMRSATNAGDGRDHFGFVDGLSQPVARPLEACTARDKVATGELLWGYRNDREDGPQAQSPYWDNGSFLVVRKMRQDVDGLHRFLRRTASCLPGVDREEVLAKMMGRTRDGVPLMPRGPGGPNDFDYEQDQLGGVCPFQAHIRRANPRKGEHGRPPPRIVRRGLSYGPAARIASDEERGVLFMAFNASIAEQFEVIQRWINGSNSTSVASCQGDPFMAVARDDEARTFRFCHKGDVKRIDLQEPLVTPRWGLYLFAPSRAGLEAIAKKNAASSTQPPAEEYPLAKAEAKIAELQALATRDDAGRQEAGEGWKALLEDIDYRDPARTGMTQAIHAAIRTLHGGALRIVYPDADKRLEAVLVTTRAGALEVLRGKPFSMQEQRRRMALSLGSIYLGLDDGRAYRAQSARMNNRLKEIGEKDAFDLARDKAGMWLQRYFGMADTNTVKLDLRLGFLPGVLAEICREWFGVPDCPPPAGTGACGVEAGGWHWEPIGAKRRPRCPGDFTAPSRYCFYPDPTDRIAALGQTNARTLIGVLTERLQDFYARGQDPAGSITRDVAAYYQPSAKLAETIIGVMTGFLPPAEGSLRAILYDWLDTDTLWRIQSDLLAATGSDYERAKVALDMPVRRAMGKRPAPDLLFRTATARATIGGVKVCKGDRVIVAVAGATGDTAGAGTGDVFPIFGGDRWGDPHPPTHACPAYQAAMGVILGTVSALLDAGRIEKLPATLMVKLTR